MTYPSYRKPLRNRAAPIEEKPKTALVRKLLRIRKKIEDSGAKLLSWDELEREITARRGER
jgi:hypothetical protein